MLILGSRLINTPIMGLQTGTRLAVTKKPIIDPSNLKIIAYEVDGPLLSEHPSLILVADVRELSNIGMIIDSNDEFIGPNDVIKVKSLYKLNFNLIGLNVIDEKHHKLGKVHNYSLDVGSFIIQQLSVKPSIIKSFGETEVLIHRTQIVEINNQSIIVKSTAQKIETKVDRSQLSYINPFRSTSTRTEVSKFEN